MSNDCLVCGSQQSGKKYLINKLTSDVEFDHINDKQSKCTWNIVNKYYTSDVTLTIINDIKSMSTLTDSDESKNDSQSINSNNAIIHGQVDYIDANAEGDTVHKEVCAPPGCTRCSW